MKILVDECLPGYLTSLFPASSAVTVQEAGWSSLKNGPLLKLAEDTFDVFLTADQNLRYQQNLKGRKIAVILFPSNRLPVVKEYEEKLRQALSQIKPGAFVELKTFQDSLNRASDATSEPAPDAAPSAHQG
jgi:predicted nuclease of predicted toxin-antitoxin system